MRIWIWIMMMMMIRSMKSEETISAKDGRKVIQFDQLSLIKLTYDTHSFQETKLFISWISFLLLSSWHREFGVQLSSTSSFLLITSCLLLLWFTEWSGFALFKEKQQTWPGCEWTTEKRIEKDLELVHSYRQLRCLCSIDVILCCYCCFS